MVLLTLWSPQLTDNWGEKEEEDEAGTAQLREEFFIQQRTFPFDTIPADWRVKALEHIRKNMRIEPQATNTPVSIGPAPITGGRTFNQLQNLTGRITSLAIDPADPSIIYLGAAQGGLWRSTDSGQIWQPMTDSAPTLAVGAIAVNPNNRNIIYVGTGEGNDSLDSFFGMGILKSTDGGETWVNLAAQTFSGLSFSKLLIDPRNPETLYGAAAFGFAGIGGIFGPLPQPAGVYKSTNGGASWSNVFKVLISGFNFDAFDVEMDPVNSSVLYASIFGQGIFKTTDGGSNWNRLAGGLPRSGFGRSDLAVSRSNPNVLYTSFQDLSTIDLLNIFKSTDGGNSWNAVLKPPRTRFGNICFCFYDNFVEIDPTNPDVVYFGGVGFYKSNNGGQSWTDISSGSIGMHEDYHAMAFVPGDPRQFYIGSDGGIWFSPDGGNTLVNRNTNLSISQFQSIALHPTDPNIMIGGTQDNGTNLFTGNNNWRQVDIADGGFSAIDQADPNVMYHTYQNVPGIIGPARSREGGARGTWTPIRRGIEQTDNVLFYAPFIVDPNNPSTLYFGTFRLYRSKNQGDGWVPISDRLTAGSGRAAISTISIAPEAPQIIYTGSSDGAIFFSNDGGNLYQNVTGNLPMRFISDIVFDPQDNTVIYASLSGFRSGHVFKTSVGSANWTDMSGNLPDLPANSLVINPSNSANLFVGTDIGLFETIDGGLNWSPVPGMPRVAVFDLAISKTLGILRIATHGRGVYEINLGPPNFSLSITPPTQSIMAGNSAGFTINIQAIGDFTQTVGLGAAISPADSNITASLSSAAVAPGGNATLTINTTTAAQTGLFTITVTGTAGQLSRTATAMVNVVQSDFELVFNPAQINVSRGKAGKLTVNINRIGNFAGNVTVTAPDTKAIKIKLSPPSQSTTGASLLFDFKVKKGASLGAKQLVFTGRDDSGRVRTATLTLLVQ